MPERPAFLPTQKQMFYRTQKVNAELDQQFLKLVEDGLTRAELQRLIDRRPSLWSRWASWLDKLPE